MALIKTSVLTAISTAIRMGNGFVLTKIVAIYTGPSGLAFIGQFQGLSAIVMGLANGATSTGIVKYTAEYQQDEGRKRKLFSTAFVMSLFFSFFISMALAVFRKNLSTAIFKTDEYSDVFLIFSFTVFFFALNLLLLSVLNGLKEIKKFTIVNIVSSFVGLGLTSLLIVWLGFRGALISNVTVQSIMFFVTLSFVCKTKWVRIEYFLQGIDKEYLVKLSKYSLMSIISVISVPASHMFVRDYIGETISWEAAGLWQGVWRISDVYLMLITTSLGVYYLPRLSEIQDKHELKNEVFYVYKMILPVVIVLATLIYLFREQIVLILYSGKFLGMKELFMFQLIGDVVKIASWILGYIMVAKAMMKMFIATEIIFVTTFVLFSIYFIDRYGLIGATYAFFINYLIYLITLVIYAMDNYYRKNFFIEKKNV